VPHSFKGVRVSKGKAVILGRGEEEEDFRRGESVRGTSTREGVVISFGMPKCSER